MTSALRSKSLTALMRDRAGQDGLAVEHKLRSLADALDRAVDGYFAPQQTADVKQLLGAWARARKAWCEYTGESLL